MHKNAFDTLGDDFSSECVVVGERRRVAKMAKHENEKSICVCEMQWVTNGVGHAGGKRDKKQESERERERKVVNKCSHNLCILQ